MEVAQQNKINLEPSSEELNNLSLAAQALWDLDYNAIIPFKDYEINLQSGKKAFDHEDRAQDPLFKYVNKNVWEKETYKHFFSLLDNYQAETGIQEEVTTEEKKENWDFLTAIMKQPLMKYLHNYLIAKGQASKDETEFKRELNKLWFYLYKREVQNDSSGFEHVFLGEIRGNKVIGFHNWIQIFNQETQGKLDYKGWILPRKADGNQTDPTGKEQLITLQFNWEGHQKNISSSFIGRSPEFEIALYTLMFYCGKQDNHIQIDSYKINVKCYRINGKQLGTCYPMAE